MSDSSMIIDLSNYKDRVGARVHPDRYRVVVEDAEANKSQAGNDMIELWLRIVGGEFDGQTITDRLTITEKSLFRVVGFMQAIHMPTPKKRLQIDIRKFAGLKLEVDVDDGTPYNGRVKSEVKAYYAIPRTSGDVVSTEPEFGDEAGFDEFASLPETASLDLPEEISAPVAAAPVEVQAAPVAAPVAVPVTVPESAASEELTDLESIDLT